MTKAADTGKVAANGEMLVIDLGKKSRKQIKRLRKGTGKLVDDVKQCMQELQAAGSVSESSRPVVVVVHEKRSRMRMRLPW